MVSLSLGTLFQESALEGRKAGVDDPRGLACGVHLDARDRREGRLLWGVSYVHCAAITEAPRDEKGVEVALGDFSHNADGMALETQEGAYETCLLNRATTRPATPLQGLGIQTSITETSCMTNNLLQSKS